MLFKKNKEERSSACAVNNILHVSKVWNGSTLLDTRKNKPRNNTDATLQSIEKEFFPLAQDQSTTSTLSKEARNFLVHLLLSVNIYAN